jgi:hypothetical protein
VADTVPVGVRNRKPCMELVQDYRLYSDDAALHNFFYQTKYFTVSRHQCGSPDIRTKKFSWSQCWFVDKNFEDSTLHKYLILFFSERPELPVRTARKCKDDILQGTLTCLQSCYVREIHKSNCCLMISYHTRGQNCSKQTDMEGNRFRTKATRSECTVFSGI